LAYRLLAVGFWARQNQKQKQTRAKTNQQQEQKQTNSKSKSKGTPHDRGTETRKKAGVVCYHSCVPIGEIYVSGYRSVRDLELKLRPINVLTGTNGETKTAGLTTKDTKE